MQTIPSDLSYLFHGKSLDNAMSYRKKITGDLVVNPSELEIAMGMLAEQIDPLIRDAVFIFTGKGYFLAESCQGHVQRLPKGSSNNFQPGTIVEMAADSRLDNYSTTPDTAKIVFAGSISPEAQDYFLKEQLMLKVFAGRKPTDKDNPAVYLIASHGDMTAKEFFEYINSIAQNAPKQGEVIYNGDIDANTFRRRLNISVKHVPENRFMDVNFPNIKRRIFTPLE